MDISEIYINLLLAILLAFWGADILIRAIWESDDAEIPDVVCPHPKGRCKIMKASDIQANGFDVVQDQSYPNLCHVLQCEDAREDFDVEGFRARFNRDSDEALNKPLKVYDSK